MKLINYLINKSIQISYKKDYENFISSTKAVSSSQKNILFGILKKNKDSIFGKEHDFSGILTIKEFQDKVPIATYDNYEKSINKHMNKQCNELVSEEILLFELTSGSASTNKHIPYTSGLKREFKQGINPWIYDMYSKNPKLASGKAYWQITPVSCKREKTKVGIPMGFEDDSEYLGFFQNKLMGVVSPIPKELKEVKNLKDYRYLTQLFLIKNKEISFISVWNPSFLTILFSDLKENLPSLLVDLKNGKINRKIRLGGKVKSQLEKYLGRNSKRAQELSEILKSNDWSQKSIKKLFPSLELISCWTDANAKFSIPHLKSVFSGVKIKGKGLIATECFVSLPLFDMRYPVLSICSHFFEFIEIGNNAHPTGKVFLAHELKKGSNYKVIVTTSGGFYRYDLGDIVKCKGYFHQAPMLEFIGKAGNVSDLFGEKLNEIYLRISLDKILRHYKLKPGFALFAPEKEGDKYFYVLYLECSNIPQNLIQKVEAELSKNFHYSYCRKIGQLEKSRVFVTDFDAQASYFNKIKRGGIRLGNIKNSCLNKSFGWSQIFNGRYLE